MLLRSLFKAKLLHSPEQSLTPITQNFMKHLSKHLT